MQHNGRRDLGLKVGSKAKKFQFEYIRTVTGDVNCLAYSGMPTTTLESENFFLVFDSHRLVLLNLIKQWAI